MKPFRKEAIIAGVLFLVSMTSSMVYTSFYRSTIYGPLSKIHPARTDIITGSFLEVINCVAVVGLAVVLSAVIKKINVPASRSYFSLRIIESTVLITGVIFSLLLIPLSHDFLKAGSTHSLFFESIRNLILYGKHMALQMALIMCGISGLILTGILYKTILIPRSISVLGFVGYVLVLVSVVLDIAAVIDTVHGAGAYLYLPGGLFEAAIFPLWLIIKGFNTKQIFADMDSGDM